MFYFGTPSSCRLRGAAPLSAPRLLSRSRAPLPLFSIRTGAWSRRTGGTGAYLRFAGTVTVQRLPPASPTTSSQSSTCACDEQHRVRVGRRLGASARWGANEGARAFRPAPPRLAGRHPPSGAYPLPVAGRVGGRPQGAGLGYGSGRSRGLTGVLLREVVEEAAARERHGVSGVSVDYLVFSLCIGSTVQPLYEHECSCAHSHRH